MHYTGPVYRHPLEARTPLLQITAGCSHNKCTFCTMYKDVDFSISSMEHIEEDLQELRRTYPRLPRIFLVNGDPFALPAKRLEQILTRIIEVFPEMETISTYSSVRNLKGKNLDELKRLKELRLNDLYVGLESGNDAALKIMNKGYDSEQAYSNLGKLKEVGISYMALILLGMGGLNEGMKSASDTAALLNATAPKLISVIPLGIFPGSNLETLHNAGKFVPPTEREMLEEERELLRKLEVEDCLFYGSHMNNLVSVSGNLPHDREVMIKRIDAAVEQLPAATLDAFADRSTL
ncbi:radical SAM protein [Desulfovibrio sp. JC010]|uniref:radical SAM protein n=1 Tax=Desulfovibrio sp. JC010 TaxID=2593641 RepID=UPI0013D80AFF|nr:radical SAM protein [Desulfovibrio sp. JC010]NDV27550.1 radical SAM protein [Desulfovibrio sp. JC010]